MKRGQVSIFVIIAILLVVGIVLFFVVRGSLRAESIPAEFVPIYNLYEECIQEEAGIGIDLLGSQGGRIDVGSYIPGSDYAPYGNQLNFLSSGVPYWYSITGNGMISENAPSKSDMERELNSFIEQRLNDNCDFSNFYSQGFYIDLGEPRVVTRIDNDKVSVEVASIVSSVREDSSAVKRQFSLSIDSKLGQFYDDAVRVYEKELSEGFLDEYAVDVLRLYAPVDGVEIQCGPEVWETGAVVEDLQAGLEANLGKLKFGGDYYTLSDKEDEYFVVDSNVENPVRVLYSRDWPSKIEVTPATNAIMLAEPVGNQQGLGVMGFCYVPYHFVWDVGIPIMVQVYDGTELFQFPMVLNIDNNVARKADLNVSFENSDSEYNVCDFKEGQITVNTFDTRLNAVPANIKFGCLNDVCDLGRTEISGDSAVLSAEVPQCVNGYVIADAEGYARKKVLFSSNNDGVLDVILDKEYDLNVEVRINGRALQNGETALVHFISEEEGIDSAVIPEARKVSLQENSYEISAYVYGESSINLPASKRTECQTVSRSGIAGLFGFKEEQCYDIDIPATTIEQALIGGGRTNAYILESDLSTGRIVIDVEQFPTVSSVEQLQYNYALFEEGDAEVSFG